MEVAHAQAEARIGFEAAVRRDHENRRRLERVLLRKTAQKTRECATQVILCSGFEQNQADFHTANKSQHGPEFAPESAAFVHSAFRTRHDVVPFLFDFTLICSMLHRLRQTAAHEEIVLRRAGFDVLHRLLQRSFQNEWRHGDEARRTSFSRVHSLESRV